MAGISTMALLAVSAAKTGIEYSNQRRAAGAAEREGELLGLQYDQNALQHDRNAGLIGLEAADVRARAGADVLKVRGAARRLAGDQRAAMAAQGIDLDSGSAADVVENDQRLAEIDVVTIRNNARKEAWGIEVQAQDARYQGALTRYQGDLARVAGRNQAASIRSQATGTLLSGAAELMAIQRSSPKPGKRTSPYTASGHRRGGPI